MPTKLGQVGYRRFDPQNRSSKARGASLGAAKTLWLRGPWKGYEPDLDHSQAAPGSARETSNMIEHEGVLSQQNGFERVGTATLPLGGTSPPDVGSEEPVVGIFEGRTNSTQAIRRYAVTSDTTGHFYELVSGVWTHRVFDANGTGLSAFAGDGGDPASTLVDGAHFDVGDYTVFASGQANPIYRFPGAGTAAAYEPITNIGTLTSLRANSVCSFDERIHAFGCTVDGTYHPARWLWTTRGANGTFSHASVAGSGEAYLNEFGGEGLAVRQLGPKLALYMTNGVMIAERTGNVNDPYRRGFATRERGILGTHAVCDLGGGVHFGLFTDGWFLLSHDGQWEERGVDQRGYKRWHREFYGTLDWSNRKRVICRYDEGERVIYIAFPQAGASGNAPSMVWLYNLQTDTVWPAPDYQYMPNCFGSYIEEATAGLTWDTATMTWAGSSGSWGSLETQVGRRRVQHGTSNGLIFTHRPDLVTRDGILPTYLYRLHYFGAAAETYKKLDTVHINYTRVQGAGGAEPTPITVAMENENARVVTGTISQTEGSVVGTPQTDFVSGAVNGTMLRVALSGQAPVKISGIGLKVYEEASSVRKEDAD